MNRTVTPAELPAPPLRVYTLGRFAVYRGETPIEEAEWQRHKAKTLFKLLLCAPQRHLLKDRVLDLLWPEKPPDAAANNLHRTLFVLRRVLQPDLAGAGLSHYLWLKDDVLALDPAAIAWVDAEQFEDLLRAGRRHDDDPASYAAALELYQGDFLPDDREEDWAESRRRALQQGYVDLLKHVSALHSARGEYRQAIDYLCLLLRVEPADEEVQRELMRLYARTGARHRALRLYQHSRQVLHAELNAEPAAETTALYEAILDEHLEHQPAAAAPLVQGAPGVPPPLPEEPQRTPLVGREAEMRQLTAHLRQAQRGAGGVVFLIGEQGVGKTRLGEEFAAYARSTGARTQYGAAFEGEGRLLYAPFVEAIRHGLDPPLLRLIRQRLGPWLEDLAPVLPELVVSTAAGHGPADAAIDRLTIETGDQQRRRLFDAMAMTYAVLAEPAPVLVLLDNLHAVGETSLQLLHYLARRLAGQRILLLCTVDQARLQRGAPITVLLGELQRHHLAQRIELGRLTPDDVTQVCIHLLDASVRQSEIPASVYELTEGNPFFVKELVLSLVKLGKIERRGGRWQLLPEAAAIVPAGVQEVIGVRLGHLSNAAYQVLGAAAVIGNTFGSDLLGAVAAGNRGSLLDALDEIVGEGLIEATETGYRFQHAMIRQAVYHTLAPERRAWLHEQVAHALEALTAPRLDEQAAVLAFHYEHAGDVATAFRYLLQAGDRARRAHATREAREHYDHAFTLYQRHLDPTAVESTSPITALLERRSQTCLALSDFDAVIGDLEQLLKAYGERGLSARAGETLYQLGYAHYWAHRLSKATAYLEQALAAADALGYDELRTRALRLRDILSSTQGRIADTDSTPEASPAASPAARADAATAEEYWGSAMLAHLHSDFASALRHAQACIAAGQALDNTFLTLGGHFIAGMAQANLGDYQPALDALQGAVKLSESSGDRFWRARFSNTMGWIYRELFNLEQALRCDRLSLELARASTPRLTEAEGNALANLATTNLLLERYATARAYVREGLTSSDEVPFMRWRYFTRLLVVQGRLALAEGRPREALAEAERALDLAQSTRARKSIAAACLLRGAALLALDDAGGARAALEQALTLAQELGSPHLTWSAHLALAEVDDALGRAEEARRGYRAALEIVEQIASRLTDARLRDGFLEAGPIRALRRQAQGEDRRRVGPHVGLVSG